MIVIHFTVHCPLQAKRKPRQLYLYSTLSYTTQRGVHDYKSNILKPFLKYTGLKDKVQRRKLLEFKMHQ